MFNYFQFKNHEFIAFGETKLTLSKKIKNKGIYNGAGRRSFV